MGNAIKQPPASQLYWVHWPHIRTFFYVYSYASGLLVSKILQQRLADNPKFIKDIKWLLALGSVLDPATALKKINIDLTSNQTWSVGLEAIAADLIELKKLV